MDLFLNSSLLHKTPKLFLALVILLFSNGCLPQTGHSVYKIGFAQCTGNDVWRKQMLKEIEAEMAFHPDFEFEYRDAGANNQRQIDDVNYFIDRKIDLLIITPNESKPLTAVVEKAFNKGIKVIVADRRVESERYTAFVGADNFAIGLEAGNYAIRLLNGKGKITEIWGLMGSTPAQERHRGFSSAISNSPGITISNQIEGKWEYDSAKKNTRTHLSAISQSDLIYAHNDIMAKGAYEVLHEHAPANKPFFIGVDGLAGRDGGIQLVEDSILNATFLYPTGGQELIRIASEILQGKSFTKLNTLQSTVIDRNNAAVMKVQGDHILNQQLSIVRQNKKIREQATVFKNQQNFILILSSILAVLLLVGYVLYFQVSRKNRLYKMLDASEKRYRLLTESAPVGIHELNAQAGMVYANSKWFEIAGIPTAASQEIICNAIDSRDRERVMQEWSKAVTEKREASVEFRFNNPHRGEVWVISKTVPIFTNRGDVQGYLGTLSDVTSIKEDEQKQIKHAILESKNKEMEQLVYITSHDLREPLLTIQNYTNILVEDDGDRLSDEGKKYAVSILRAIEHMDKLIHALLDYSRLSKSMELERVNINEIVNDVIENLNSVISVNRVKISVTQLPDIKGYVLPLKLLFQNLISNAIKFVRKGCSAEITISAEKINTGWKFKIADNGIGIAPCDNARIFDLFQRLHLRSEYEGTGIGLAHCKKIVEMHHGTIWVESEPEKGSQFWFTIQI